MLLAGAAVGSLSGSSLANQLGRKNSLLLTALPLLAGAALSASAKSLEGMLAGRIVAGIGIGLSSALVPLYISEVLAPAARCLTLRCWLGAPFVQKHFPLERGSEQASACVTQDDGSPRVGGGGRGAGCRSEECSGGQGSREVCGRAPIACWQADAQALLRLEAGCGGSSCWQSRYYI